MNNTERYDPNWHAISGVIIEPADARDNLLVIKFPDEAADERKSSDEHVEEKVRV